MVRCILPSLTPRPPGNKHVEIKNTILAMDRLGFCSGPWEMSPQPSPASKISGPQYPPLADLPATLSPGKISSNSPPMTSSILAENFNIGSLLLPSPWEVSPMSGLLASAITQAMQGISQSFKLYLELGFLKALDL